MTLKERAQELLATRLAALDDIEEASARVERAREELRTAEAAFTAAWSAANSAGWTAAELRRLGLSQPATRRGGRPRAGRRAVSAPASTPAPAESA